jgi:hypothetical protein
MCWLNSNGRRQCPAARFEEGNEILGSIRRGKVTDLLIHYQYFEKVWSIFHRGVRIGGVL